MTDFNINDVLEVVAWTLVWAFIISTLAVMYLTKPEGRTTTMNIAAAKLKAGDTIITKDGSVAKIAKIKSTDVKIPARVEKSIVLMVNLSNGTTAEYAIGTSNLQMWGHEQVTKVVEPGFFKKFMAFIRSL